MPLLTELEFILGCGSTQMPRRRRWTGGGQRRRIPGFRLFSTKKRARNTVLSMEKIAPHRAVEG